MAVRMKVANIGPGGRRRRVMIGVSAWLVALVVVGLLLALGAGPGWHLLGFLPFFLGALGLIQARDHT